MKLLTLDDLNINNKKVLLRVDYNVVEDGKVIDEFRVKSSLPTIEYLLEHNCSVILISHNGRPNGKVIEGLSLRPVAKLLPKLLGRDVIFLDNCVGAEVAEEAHFLRAGDVMLLENLRFHKEEEANTAAFSRALANLAEIYVDDAFAAVHRAHASIVGVPRQLPHCAGLLIEREFNTIEALNKKPAKPYTAIIGGAKISDKIEVLDELLKHVNALLIGGAMANTFLAANGINMQKSLVEKDSIKDAKKIMSLAKRRKVKLVLPTDLVVAKSLNEKAKHKTVGVNNLGKGDIALDLGPDTAELFCDVIAQSKTVFWNGTLGMAEIKQYSCASETVAHAMISSTAKTIVGGGDTAAFVDKSDLYHHFSFVSTGGGASLELLAGKKLPGIVALEKS